MTHEEMQLLLGDIMHLEKQRASPSCQLEANRLLQIYLHATQHAQARGTDEYAPAATERSSSQIDDDIAFMVTTTALFD
jgi:hypothetical protein